MIFKQVTRLSDSLQMLQRKPTGGAVCANSHVRVVCSRRIVSIVELRMFPKLSID
jgi:hypothetical protein